MTKEFQNKNDTELQKLLEEKRKSLRLFRFSVAGSKIKNIKEGMNLRKAIARILTETNSRRTATFLGNAKTKSRQHIKKV